MIEAPSAFLVARIVQAAQPVSSSTPATASRATFSTAWRTDCLTATRTVLSTSLLPSLPPFFAAAVGERDERVHKHAAFDSLDQRLFDVALVEAEDYDLDALFGFLDALDERLYAITRLDQQLQSAPCRTALDNRSA